MTQVVLRARRHTWDDVGCFALDYLPGEDRHEERRVGSIKTGDLNSITQGAQLLAASLDERRHLLDDTHERTALIAVPGHRAEAPRTTERLCAELARVLPWLEHRPDTIRRHRPIRRSAGAADRPSVAEHLATLRWCGSPGRDASSSLTTCSHMAASAAHVPTLRFLPGWPRS